MNQYEPTMVRRASGRRRVLGVLIATAARIVWPPRPGTLSPLPVPVRVQGPQCPMRRESGPRCGW